MEMSCSAAAVCAGLAGAGTAGEDRRQESGAGMATTNTHIRILQLGHSAYFNTAVTRPEISGKINILK